MCDRINNNCKVEEWMNALTLEEKVSLYTGKNFWQTQNIDRLGIPSVTVSDGTNGVRFQKGSKSEESKGALIMKKRLKKPIRRPVFRPVLQSPVPGTKS